MKKKISFSPQEFWEPDSIQSWLEWEARRGWRITSYNGWFCTFQKTEPKECRVRIQPHGPESNEAYWERLDAYKEMGWEHAVNLALDYGVYYCDDPNAPELDTDQEVYALAWKKPVRKGLWSAWGLLVAAVFIMVSPVFYRENFMEFLMLADFRMLFCVLLAGPLLFVMALRQLWKVSRVCKALSAGVAPPDGSWKRSRNWGRASLLLLLCLILVMPVFDLIWAINIEAVSTTDIPYVSHEELAPELPEDDWDLVWREYVNTCKPLAPDRRVAVFCTEEGCRVKNTQERLRFEWLAKAEYNSLQKDFAKDWPAAEVIEISREAFDEAVLLQSGSGEQMLLVRSGCVVYSLRENLSADLADWVEPVAAEMKA